MCVHSNCTTKVSLALYLQWTTSIYKRTTTPTTIKEKYIEVQEIGQISYRSLHTVIKVGKKWIPTQRSYNRVGIRLENPKVSHIWKLKCTSNVRKECVQWSMQALEYHFLYYVNKDKFIPKHLKPAAPIFDYNSLNTICSIINPSFTVFFISLFIK